MQEKATNGGPDGDRDACETEVAGCAVVVDDEERNRRLLRDLLVVHGYRVLEAIDGEEAMRVVRGDPPDVILLDVMMPKLNGFEVCGRLKADEKTAPIPVLMVTSLGERSDRLKGIQAGAGDFITKPIDTEEVLLRVRNAVRMKRLHDTVRQDLHKLRELEQLRDNLTHMIIHDMRSPLMAIMGGLQLLEDKERAVANSRFLTMALSATQELAEMVNSLLDISRMECGEMPLNPVDADLKLIAQIAVESNTAGAEFAKARVAVVGESARASFDKDLIHRVLSNLIGNAIKFAPEESVVEVRIRCNEGNVRAEVIDAGPGIPAEYHEKIFKKFGQIEARRNKEKHSTGLGLTFCKLAIEAHSGRIGVDSEVGAGSTFWFELPRYQAMRGDGGVAEGRPHGSLPSDSAGKSET